MMSPGDGTPSPHAAKTFLPSLHSFKVLSECPIILVLLFQIFKKLIGASIPAVIPTLIKVRFCFDKVWD
jgi:transformation/transcription domain-associated protein